MMKNLNIERNLIIIILLNFVHFSNCNFSKEFLFGAASSAHQIEGAWNAEGKGENIWDRFTHTHPELIDNGDNGDVACNSYYQYKEDVKLLSGAGVYRFSISWARISHNGSSTHINPAGVQYYRNLIENLLEHKIEPMVTMYHWDLPRTLEDLGGWRNSSIIQYMVDYADVLFRLLGDKVKWWVTINEPQIMVLFAKHTSTNPSDYKSPDDNLMVIHNVIRSHGRIFRLYDRKYRSSQNGKISIAIKSDYCEPKTSSQDDAMAAEISFQFKIGILAGPIYSNESDYPAVVKQIVEAYTRSHGRSTSPLPTFTDEEKQEIKGSFDFYAMNHYTSRMCSGLPSNGDPTVIFGIDVNISTEFYPESWGSPSYDWFKVVPRGMSEILKLVKTKYNNPPVFITENGYGDQGELNDVDRISFHRKYITEMLRAMNEYECNVIGYTAWSILDNFEWIGGYKSKFGLVHVDFNDTLRTRTPKWSYSFFKSLTENRSLPNRFEGERS